MQLASVIREISVDLNDQVPGHEYVRWSVEQLQTYVREVLITIGQQLQDLYTEFVVVKVQPGTGWQEACDCTQVLRIIGESDAEGNVIRYLTRSADVEANVWAGPANMCPALVRNYTMAGYTTNITKPNHFKISPPVPFGAVRYVLAECFRRPRSTDLTEDVPDEIVAMVKQWALYRALSVDSENNPTITQLAQSHYKAYTDMLSVAVLEREKRDVESSIRATQKPPAQ